MTSRRFSPARSPATVSVFAMAAFAVAAIVARGEALSADNRPLQEPGLSKSAWQSIHDFFTWKHGQGGVYPIMDIDVWPQKQRRRGTICA
jgi:hypothetical protein